MQSVASTWLENVPDLGTPGNPKPKPTKSAKGPNFRFHLKNLKMALVLQNHHQDPYWSYYNTNKKNNFFCADFWVFSNSSLVGVNLFWKFKSPKKPSWGHRGLAFEIRRGPKNAERHEGLNAVACNWLPKCLDLGMPGNPNPSPKKPGRRVQFQNSPEKLEDCHNTHKPICGLYYNTNTKGAILPEKIGF